MGLFGKSKRELLEWQNLLTSSPSRKLVMTESQLTATSQRVAANHLKILKESAELCNKTKKPDVFFLRYKLLLEHGEQLIKLSKYVKFTGTSPKASQKQVIKQRSAAIRQLIDRCFEDAELLKTDSAKKKRYNKILNDFFPYKAEMDKDNWNYLEDVCIRKSESK